MKNIELKKMSLTERLHTMEALWDSLQNEGERIKSPEWHEEILYQRLKKIKDGKAKFISLNDLKKSF